jgi:2-polyprenyl-6-methoxyphenol hydroxylase-like FAD-dependent oxidoreductase
MQADDPERSVPVLVVGAGGTGMAAALELVRHGVPFRSSAAMQARSFPAGGIGIHPRTLELLSLRGRADAFAKAGLPQERVAGAKARPERCGPTSTGRNRQ